MIIKQRKLFRQILLTHLSVIFITIGLIAWYGARSVDAFYISEQGRDLENRAHLIASQVLDLLAAEKIEQLRKWCIDSGRASETRITVIAPNGTVVADTKEAPAVMDNHRMRPEIATALEGGSGFSLRYSKTLGERMLYAAIALYEPRTGARGPLRQRHPITAVLRLSMPVTAIDSALHDIKRKFAAGTLVAIISAFMITYFVSRNMSRPLEEMTRSAQQYAEGDFTRRLKVPLEGSASKEIATLALALDCMAQQLDEKLSTIINQRNQLETVFAGMVEAVIAVDRDERVISINDAAVRMFGLQGQAVHGRLIQELIRNNSLHQQIERILLTDRSFEDEIILDARDGNTYLQTNVVSLYGGGGKTIGALVVLNDVTRLRRLERMRSDFVANVSHELRTPITSIRGYVETLLDGALDNREDAVKFLDIILRQSEQLNEIIEDLLALSRIEKEAQEGEVATHYQKLLPILESALNTCRYKAEEKGVILILDCPETVCAKVNRTLIEQAVVNLLVNGITYSEYGGEVTVQARTDNDAERGKVRISVTDRGVGIAEEHLPRLFERFYRSDRARNRKVGGTGLGLAIVKHIVQAHGGTVDVRSRVGTGSEFIISLNNE